MQHLSRSTVLIALTLCLTQATAQTTAQAQTVGTMVDRAHSCSTSGPRSWALDDQLARAQSCFYPSALVPMSTRSGLTYGAGILRYSSPETRDAIYAAAGRTSFNVNSAFRTLLQQYYLSTARAPACMAVASPGGSNHESGTAVDVSPDGRTTRVRSALEGAGCRWLGAGDVVHFDCLPRGATARTVITFQRLWNLNHPTDRIAEDNAYGPNTRERLRQAPITGFSNDGCSPTPPVDAGPPDAGPPAMPDASVPRDASVVLDASVMLDASIVLDASAMWDASGTDELDAGVDAQAIGDAATRMDAPSRHAASLSSSCACRAATPTRTPWSLLLAPLLGALALWRRKRAR